MVRLQIPLFFSCLIRRSVSSSLNSGFDTLLRRTERE